MPFRISRRLCTGGRPPGLAAGTSGSKCFHSESVRSVSYARRHVIRAHQHTGPTLFKRALRAEREEQRPDGGEEEAEEQSFDESLPVTKREFRERYNAICAEQEKRT